MGPEHLTKNMPVAVLDLLTHTFAQPIEVAIIVTVTVYLKKLRFRQAKQPALGHTADVQRSRDMNLERTYFLLSSVLQSKGQGAWPERRKWKCGKSMSPSSAPGGARLCVRSQSHRELNLSTG